MMISKAARKYLYYEEPGITFLHGDCLEILPLLKGSFSTVITDPIWPNSLPELKGSNDPYGLFESFKSEISQHDLNRIAVIIGCDSDPGLMGLMPLPFFRVQWLRYSRPHYKGRLLYSGDVSYLYGIPPKSIKGRHIIGSEKCRTDNNGRETKHPCPRCLSHTEFVLHSWSDIGETVLDPFAGGCTLAEAGKKTGRKIICIEYESKYLDEGIERLKQGVLI